MLGSHLPKHEASKMHLLKEPHNTLRVAATVLDSAAEQLKDVWRCAETDIGLFLRGGVVPATSDKSLLATVYIVKEL
jgi:hypothetical protein